MNDFIKSIIFDTFKSTMIFAFLQLTRYLNRSNLNLKTAMYIFNTNKMERYSWSVELVEDSGREFWFNPHSESEMTKIISCPGIKTKDLPRGA